MGQKPALAELPHKHTTGIGSQASSQKKLNVSMIGVGHHNKGIHTAYVQDVTIHTYAEKVASALAKFS